MCPLKYDYEPNRDEETGSNRLRTIIIFIIALGVIGCGIYFLILPHTNNGSKTVPPVVPPTGTGTTDATGTGDTPTPAAASGNTAAPTSIAFPGTGGSGSTDPNQTGGGDTPSSGQPLQGDSPNTDAPASGDLTDVSGNSPTLPPDPVPTEDPQKGKPWIGDPPSEQPSADKPVETPPLPDPAASAETVVVRAGESLSRIAHKHHTTVEALRHYNQLNKDVIRVGQKLRVIPGPWRITVDQKQRRLTLERLREGQWSEFAKFPVGLGRMDSTPNAQFVISTRLRHPDWYTPDGRIYRYGDSENQLGDYFLKLATPGKPDKPLLGYGIHGTADENSVGKNWSNGCVRMRNRDVELLYYLVPSGTPVTIVPGTDAARKTEI